MCTQQLDPTHDDPAHRDGHLDWNADVDGADWYPPGAAGAALTEHAWAFLDRLEAALCDYAGAVTTALAGHGLPARAHVAAGVDLATIELAIPALAATVTDACLRFSDDIGWHYLPAGGGQWARLGPLDPAITAAAIAPPPASVAAAIAALRHGAGWPTPAPGEPTAVHALAGPWLDALPAALDGHHCPPPGTGGVTRAA